MPIATATGNAALASAAASGQGPSTSTRASTQIAANSISGAPVGVGRFAQLRTAVRRNPAMTASA